MTTRALTGPPPTLATPATGDTAVAVLVRLRPVVFATPTATGVHVRGWASSFTVSGGSGVWKIWQPLARRLASGMSPAQLATPGGRPEVARVVNLLVDQLREHDMLVEVPTGWGDRQDSGLPPVDLARWLESVAAEPAAAWDRLRASTVTVTGRGPVAASAARALAAAGVAVATVPSRDRADCDRADRDRASREARAGEAPADEAPDRAVVVQAGDVAVAAGCAPEIGYVTPVLPRSEVGGHAGAVAARLALPPAAGRAEVVPTLAALVGAAAVHRIVCAVAGLPDPAEEAATLPGGEPAVPGPHYPSVLVARLDPVRATYHPWLAAARPAVADSAPDIDAVGLRLDAVGDPVLGALPPALPGDLPQVPAMLARAGTALGIGATADAARIDATVRAAEAALAPTGPGPADRPETFAVERFAVGVDARHAAGVALRRLAHAIHHRPAASTASPAPGQPGNPAVSEHEWAATPAARRWWKALTLRYAVPARLVAHRLGPGVVHAEIVTEGGVLAWAVEATAADAAAMAALAATGVAQARAVGAQVPSEAVSLTGAAPAWQPTDAHLAPWTDDAWYWPAGVVDNEERLQADLRAVLTAGDAGLAAVAQPPVAGAALTHALSATGFAVHGYRWIAPREGA
ncbi:hypothetical protein ACN27F_08915 [Solwaraspora sp. WMMB335]|uniref:hypothetical protein n=1 Tax=Solwaraspora sp. WMMB335 TaxID=3404118 RepID=UPI003B92CC74